MQQSDKVMYVVGPVFSWRIQLLGKREERFRVDMEEVDIEDGFRVGDVVLLQVVIETSAWRPATEDKVIQ